MRCLDRIEWSLIGQFSSDRILNMRIPVLARYFGIVFLSLVAWPVAARAASGATAPRLVIVDDDGFGLAQWMVLQAPGVKVLGVATVTGDLWQKEATAHALRGLEIIGRTDIPVVPGATYPLLNSEKLTDRWKRSMASLYGAARG